MEIACSLNARESAERARWFEELVNDLLSREETPDGLTLRFRARPGLEPDLRKLAEAEARCCPFLTLEVTPGDDDIKLRITGPEEAKPIIADCY